MTRATMSVLRLTEDADGVSQFTDAPAPLRVQAGDGEVREIGVGAIWRMEDVAGTGHTTTVLGEEDVRLAIVQLP